MATIKFRRGAGQPAGLTAYEPAWDTTNNRLFVNNGSTAVWVGAPIVQDTTLAGNCAWTVPTQNSVKTYVDNQISGGAVSSVNGATGAITIAGSTGITVSTSTAARGITLTLSNVAFTDTTNSFSSLQTFTSGIAVTSGMTLSDILRLRGSLVDPGGKIELWDENNTYKVTLQTETTTAKDSTFYFGGADGHVVAADTDGATSGWIVKANGAGLAPSWINPASAGFSAYQSDRTDRLLVSDAVSNTYYFDLSGGKTGYQLHYSSNNMTWNETASRLTAPNLVATSGITTGNLTFTGTILGNVVTSLASGNTAISLSGSTGAVTATFNGVHTVAGTANQITASASTGSVILSLPSAVTMPGSLTVTGDLTVNGTTTTVNSTTVTVQDPILAIGGVTGNAPPPNGDSKDRGIVFQWNSGSAGQTGFFGLDQSTQRFTFISSGAAVASEVVSGAAGSANLAGVYAPQGTLTLQGTSGGSATITLAGNTAGTSTQSTYTANDHLFTSSTGIGRISVQGDLLDPSLKGTITTTAFTAARTFTLPDITGRVVVADAMGATSGWLLRGTGASTAPTWINPTASGFTAFTSTNINMVAVKDAVNYGLVFALGTGGNQVLYGDSTTGVMWRPSTNTLTVGAGLGFFEGIIEGGTY